MEEDSVGCLRLPSILFIFFYSSKAFFNFFLSHFKVFSSGGKGEWGAWAWGGVGGRGEWGAWAWGGVGEWVVGGSGEHGRGGGVGGKGEWGACEWGEWVAGGSGEHGRGGRVGEWVAGGSGEHGRGGSGWQGGWVCGEAGLGGGVQKRGIVQI